MDVINSVENEYGLPELAEVSGEKTAIQQYKQSVLITGVNGYIGCAFERYLMQWPEKYSVKKISVQDNHWTRFDFSKFDVIVHAAGIAHVKETDENRKLYNEINRDLTLAIAQKAKSEGVGQFVFLSSMSVYGILSGIITKDTIPKPNTAYGKSKLEAEIGLWELRDEAFVVSIVRPPMVYGKHCKGNYQTLRKFALKYRSFPRFKNQRSMLYIENLSSVLLNIVLEKKNGVYLPQNIDYICTYEMVKNISEISGYNFHPIRGLGVVIKLASKSLRVIKKVFGTLVYEKETNVPEGWIVIKDNFETIERTV